MQNIDNCPICNHAGKSEFLICRDYTVSKEEFQIMACSNCGFAFTSPRPGENDLGRYYESEEYISHSNTSKGFISWLYQRVRKHTLAKKLQLINQEASKGILLDIGCGTGEFLNTVKNGGWKRIGIEPSPLARKQGIEN